MAIKLPIIDQSEAIGIVGAGTMGVGIAEVAASAGHPVRLFDAIEGTAGAALERTARRLERRAERGRIAHAERDAIVGRMQAVDRVSELAGCRVVIEAIVEDLDVKRRLFQALERVCGEESILASNTSSLSITSLATGMIVPQRLVGMHFFNPAPVMKLVEIVSGMDTAPEIAASMHGLMSRWGKAPVFVKNSPGFIVNRAARPYYGEALALLQEGAASCATLDGIFRDCGGFRMGPFELMDLIGIDVNFAVTRSVFNAFFNDPKYRPSIVQQEMVEADRLGRKSGRGFYIYQAGWQRPAPEPFHPQAVPRRVQVLGDVGPLEVLLESVAQAGIEVQRCEGEGMLRIDDVPMALTDGRSAAERSVLGEGAPRVLCDLALDFAATPRVTLCAAAGCESDLRKVAGLFQALGKSVSAIEDLPGMVIMRTVCLLGNEAAMAVAHGVCTPGDLDTAMKLGLNYPLGPLQWIEQLGLDKTVEVVRHMHRAYGDDRYRLTPLLARKALEGGSFFEGAI